MAAVPFLTLSPPPDDAELAVELLLEEEGFTGVTFDFGVGVIGLGAGLAVLEAVGIFAVGQTTAAAVPGTFLSFLYFQNLMNNNTKNSIELAKEKYYYIIILL